MKLFELKDRPDQEKNFPRNIMPQIRKGNLQNSPFKFKKGKISLKKLKPVQNQRVKGMHDKAEQGFADGSIRPIIIDKDNYIVNGHHRYDVARGLELKKVRVLKVDASIEELINHFTDTASPEPTYEQKMKAKLDSLMETIEASQDISALMKGIEADLKQRKKDLKKLPKKSIYDENVTTSQPPNITQSKKEEIISAWEWQENLIEIGNGMLIIPAQKQDGTMHTRPDGKGGFIPYDINDILLINKDYNVLDDHTDIEKLLDNNFGIIQGEDVVDGNFPVQQRDREMQQGIERELKMYKILERLAQMWWNNDEDPAVEKKLADMGWEVGEDEGSDTPSVFVIEIGDENGNSYISWPIEQLEKDVVENFADGKKKGKSRPGRVKKAGASCNGSVTSLRKKAKNSSGEKSKMYHWCANMKGGRKKS